MFQNEQIFSSIVFRLKWWDHRLDHVTTHATEQHVCRDFDVTIEHHELIGFFLRKLPVATKDTKEKDKVYRLTVRYSHVIIVDLNIRM